MDQRSKKIKVCSEAGSTIPIIVGNCPACGMGNRSLILMGFLPSISGPQFNELFFKCICCSEVTVRKLFEVAEE